MYFFILLAISFATFHTALKSASPSNLLEGVPTVINIISAPSIASVKEDVKLSSLVWSLCFDNNSSIPGSKKGHFPFFNSEILNSSLSTQITSYPNSAKQEPETRPT